ncbi:MAG: MFS transporter [Burkholderiales bacterium]|nr:MFS transporter [Burkholderiales bacterium]
MEKPTTALFQHRAFMRLWFSRLFGTSANQMLLVALGWQMYDLTHSAWDLGLVGLLQFLPALALVLVAGQVVDRLHRARIVAVCMAAQTLVSALLIWASATHGVSRELLLLVSIAVGTVRAFQFPAQQALTPMVLPPALLPRGLAFSSAGAQSAIVAGPAIGGFVYTAGAATVYATCAVLFVIAGVLVFGVRYEQAARIRKAISLDTLLGGVRFVRDRPVVLGAISLDLFAVLFGGAVALLPIFARDLLQVGSWGLGLLRAAPAAGALLTSIVLTRFPVTRRAGRVLLSAVAVYGVATLAFGLSTSFVLSLAALVVTGAADMISVVIRQSLVQLDTPDEMRGRVSAVNSVFIGASNQLGEFESGVTAAWLGPVGSVVLGGLGTLLVAGAWVRLFPALAQRDRLTTSR